MRGAATRVLFCAVATWAVGCSGPVEGESPEAKAPTSAIPAVPKPVEIFIWFADGTVPPVSGIPCLGMTPPAYECTFGDSPADCRRTVLKRIEQLYAEYNAVFVDKAP